METVDLLKSAVNKDAVAFKTAFGELMAPKVASAIEDRKQEIGKTTFNKAAE